MAPQSGMLICSSCGWTNTAGARYCARCGEPIDPALLAELRRLYTVLQELDAQVADGLGSASVQALRDTIRERYLTQRARRPATAQPAPATIPLGQPAAPSQPVATPAAASVAASMAAPAQPAQPHGPVFSWRGFIAEQAIAVMAYLGGFLLLIATLTFEVGGWQALPDFAKLAGVLIVYVVFGLLGATLRRAASLRMVGRVYLGVFALMTPLAALAVYRFELQARGFPISGMVCLASAYAAVVYLALAARTRFATYAYLGWAALLMAALAIPPWAQLSRVWWIPVAIITALVLLAPRALWRLSGAANRAWLAEIEPSATQISGVLAALGLLAILSLGLALLTSVSLGASDGESRAAFALAACALVGLSAGWSWVARSFTLRTERDTLMTLTALDWLIAASAALAALAVATWLHATQTAFTYTLATSALVEGVVAEALRWRARQRVELRIGVQALAAFLAVVGACVGVAVAASATISGVGSYLPPDYAPLLVACTVGVALGVTFALRGSLRGVTPWGLLAGAFLLGDALAAFNAAVPNAPLYATSDTLPDALAQMPTLLALLALALFGLALALRLAPQGSALRWLRAAAAITGLWAAILCAFYLESHSRYYAALLLTLLALAALALARIERRPVAAGLWAGGFGAVASLVFVVGNQNGVVVAALPVALAGATLALSRPLGRRYVAPIYIVALLATGAAFLQLVSDSAETTTSFTPLALGLGGWMTLVVALILTLDAALTPSPLWMTAPAAIALLAAIDARDLWPLVALTLALAGVGALLRLLRGPRWEAAWHAAAVLASLIALNTARASAHDSAARTLGLALLFTLLAWLIAWQERLPWLTLVSAPYALVALLAAGDLPLTPDQRLAATFGLGLLFTLLGMAARLRLGRAWALALYADAILAAGFTATRVTPYPAHAGLLEALLLIFAALAFVAALLEETPWAALAPAAFAVAAALAQPDGRALLPLALALAASAFAVARTRGAAWSLPLYGAAMVAAVATTWQGHAVGGQFEVIALVTLALAAWLLAALESRPDALLVAYTFAVLAVSAATRAYGWEAWQATLAFAALAWVLDLSRLVWARIPWLHERAGSWLAGLARADGAQAAWRDPRRAGQRLARGAAAFVGVGAVIGGWLAPQSFADRSPQTQALAIALLSLAALFARFGWGGAGWRPALYLAGEALAFFVTWELRWFGVDNVQAWIIAPGSAQLIIGALLPADLRVRAPRWVAQVFSVLGALTLTLPTLGQSVFEPEELQWRYALLLAVEALALTLLATGLRNRLLALTGSAFVGVAAIRGAIIAVQQNLPVPLVIGVFALALMGLATWLSLRARRLPHSPTAPQ